jgi:hypothetical protein
VLSNGFLVGFEVSFVINPGLLVEIPNGLFELVGLVEISFGLLNEMSAGLVVVIFIGFED